MKREMRNPASAVDLIVENEKGEILLIERKHEPYQGMWALPGGYLDCGKENLPQAGCRELEEETDLVVKPVDLELVDVRSDPRRDPREHVIAHVYKVLRYSGEVKAGDDAANARWFARSELPRLAFDHAGILGNYLEGNGRKNGA